jgi:DNA processing protein
VPLVEDKNNYIPGEEKYWLGFTRVGGIGAVRLRRLTDYFGGLGEAWQAGVGDLLAAGLEPKLVERTVAARKSLNLEREMEKLAKQQIALLVQGGPGYSTKLAQVDNAPPLLYCRGELTERDDMALAVVGTRNATAYGRQATAQLCQELASRNVTIVSGMAKGIDTCAHQAALDAGGRTIAVLGCGVDVVYPAENKLLMQRIIEQGAVLSEYAPGTQPEASNFPPRNRIVSGMTLGVLLVEAGAKSGALITVDFAKEQGRDVFVVPGSIFSRMSEGPNRLLKDGATAVTSAADILEQLQLNPMLEEAEIQELQGDDEVERALLRLLNGSSGEALHIDELRRESGLSIAVVSSTLTMLELKGMVKHLGGMNYVAARYTRLSKGV